MTPTGSAHSLSDDLAHAVETAARAIGGFEDHYFRIGGWLPVRVRSAGSGALRLSLAPLDHLRVSRVTDPKLTVTVCEVEKLPSGPWQDAATGVLRGALPEGGFFLSYGGALTVFDRRRSVGHYLRQGPSDAPALYPLSPILGARLADEDVYLVPAAAAGDARGAVLIVGAPGSGKSHTMHACVQGGLRYAGDDACLLDAGEDAFVRSVYRTTHPSPETLALMPHLADLVAGATWASAGGHETIFLDDHHPDALLGGAPLVAIAIVERRPGSDSRTRAATPRDALAALAPWALRNTPGSGQEMLQKLSRVVRATPAVHLECGQAPDGIAAAVEGLL